MRNKKKNEVINNNEVLKNIYFNELFKYATKKEKFSLLIGIITAIVQGCCYPFLINFIGNLVDCLISLVINLALKNITGINDDNILIEFIKSASTNPKNITNLQQNFPGININEIYGNFAHSEYKNYDFNNFKGFSFKSSENISSEINKQFKILAFISLLSFISSFLYYAILDISALRQTTRIRALVFKSIMKQDISWHENASPGELTSRIISDTILIEDGIGNKFGMLIQNLTTFLICIVIAFNSQWKLTLYMSSFFVVTVVIIGLMGSVLVKMTQKTQKSYGISGGIAQEALSQIRTVVSFGNEQKEIDRYVKELEPALKLGKKKSQINGISLGLMFGTVYLSYSLLFILSAGFINRGEMAASDALKVLMGVMFGATTLGSSSSSLTSISSALGAATKLFHIIERVPKKDILKSEKLKTPIKGEIEFRNISFSYPSRPDTKVLKNINFHCEAGQIIALVGASGSGKSTIIQLLERFYEKDEGDILIDGKPIENYDIHWLRTQMGLVAQEPILFDMSIADNISVAHPESSQQEIEIAAKLADAHEFISNLPQGYQTETGEKGLQMSGGQKQRICIARALLMNPRILLLDEATSALDNKSEKIVQAALDSASSNRTTIVIAHRLTTIKNAHKIIVMDKGTIVESGSHNELMAQHNIYYNLVKNQEISINKYQVFDSNDNKKKKVKIDYSDDIIMNLGNFENFDIGNNNICNNNNNDSNSSSVLLQKRNNNNDIRISCNSNNSQDCQKSILMTNNKDKFEKNKFFDLKRYLSYNKPLWTYNLFGIFGSILNGCMQPACAFIYASAINAFNNQGEKLINETRFWGIMFIILAGVSFLSSYIKNAGLSIAGEYLSFFFRKDMYNSIIRQEIGFFDICNDQLTTERKRSRIKNKVKKNNSISNNPKNVGFLISKLTTEATLVQGLNINFGTLLEISSGIIICFIIAFLNGWKLALILSIIAPFLFIGIFVQMKALLGNSEEKRRIFQQSTNIAVEAIVGIKTVYANNLEDYFCNLYEKNLKNPQKKIEKKIIRSSLAYGFGNGMNFISYGIGYYFGYLFLKSGELSFENVFRIVMAIIFTSGTMGQASSAAPNLINSANAFNNILKIIDRHSKIDANNMEGLKKKNFQGSISLKNIQFQYPSRPKITVLYLEKDTIEIPEGKTLALVGGSGSGKSTIIGLIPRWYDPQQGDIMIDNIQNTKYNIKWLRQYIGIVNQEPFLFNTSIRENISYGKENATEKEIIEAAKKANIHDFIVSLPEGYDTVVGSEGTSQISGGQKQRIAIARAIIRQPKILLLDEATSALDAESELIVQNALKEASKGRTTIVIAHRLSTIKNADIIIVMNNGHIIEKGSHDELMNQKGMYYDMVLAGDGGVHLN